MKGVKRFIYLGVPELTPELEDMARTACEGDEGMSIDSMPNMDLLNPDDPPQPYKRSAREIAESLHEYVSGSNKMLACFNTDYNPLDVVLRLATPDNHFAVLVKSPEGALLYMLIYNRGVITEVPARQKTMTASS